MAEVSATRLYLGNLPRGVTRAQVEEHFKAHGTGEITEVKLMNGFGFIEYSDSMDARDVVPAFHGGEFMGERLTVQFARGSRHREGFANHDRPTQPRPRRTPFRLQISGLPGETSWQDLKDFARQSGLDVVYSETGRDRDGKGCFVEFETAADLRTAVEKLDQKEFKGDRVTCVADIQEEHPRDRYARSRSPRRNGYPRDDGYDRRGGGGRNYTPPRRHDYRERSPPPRPREFYDSRDRYRSPPRARGPEDYPPPRRGGYPDDPYERPRGGYGEDPYMNGNPRQYGRPRSPAPSRGERDYPYARY